MTSHKPAQKPKTSAPGMKTLITAASLVATLGGWALISSNEVKPVPAPAPAPGQAASRTVTIKLAPLPTLVPPITLQPQPQLVTINQPHSAASAPQQQSAPATTLVLRDVTAPQLNGGGSGSASAPAPVANTRSSR